MGDFADIAHPYQAGTDLAVYAREHDRVALKATQGTTYTNPFFVRWWRQAGDLGLARIAYHYAKPSRSLGPAEANHFLDTVEAAGGLGPRDVLWLDVEDPDEHGPKAADHAARLCERVVQRGYPGLIVYSYGPYLQGCGLTAVMLPPQCRWLHIANYNAGVADDRVPLPPGWDRSQVLGRQYTDKATQPGIPGVSDRNRVLREWLPGVAAAPEEEDDMPSADEVATAVVDRLSEQMRQLVTTDPDTGVQVRMEDVKGIPNIGLAVGLLVQRSSFGMTRDKATRDEVARIGDHLGADGPLVAWTRSIGTDLAAVRADLTRLTAGTGGAVDLSAVFARLDALDARLAGLTLTVTPT